MATPAEDKNVKHRIAAFKAGKNDYSVYLLNPGERFREFGGSRHDCVPTKTASLILRTVGPMGLHDAEHDINSEAAKGVWSFVFKHAGSSPPATRIAVSVSNGVVTGAVANLPGVHIDVCDFDVLKADGKDRDERRAVWVERTRGLHYDVAGLV